MTRRGFRTLSVAALALVPLALTACGGDDDDAGGSDLEQQVSARLMENSDDSGVTQEQADCAADKMVAAVGDDRARELLAEPEGSNLEELLTAEEQESFFSAAVTCLDMRELMVEQFVSGGMSEDDANCIVDALGEDKLSEMAQASASGEEPDPAAIAEAVSECGVADM